MDRACQQIPDGKLDCIAVSFGQDSGTRAWAARSGLHLKFAQALDPEFNRRYVDWLMLVPLVFLVDEDGTIRYKGGGERSDEYDASLVRDFAR